MTPCPDLPGPNSQNLGAVCYLATARYIIPTTDPNLWGVFTQGGGKRELVGILTTEELITSFRDDWIKAIASYNERQAAEELARSQTYGRSTPSVSTADLDDILSDLTLDF